MAAGMPFGLKPGHTSTIRRIEGGMLSYQADADINTNPYELGMDRLVDLDIETDFIGKTARRRIRENGVTRKQVGLRIEGTPLRGPNTAFWPVRKDGKIVGKVTSAIHSPRLKQNIALAMVSTDSAEIGSKVEISMPQGTAPSTVVHKPFFDPKKQLAVA